jgi:acyl dehydratase
VTAFGRGRRSSSGFLADDPSEGMVVDRSREKRADRRFELPAEGAELPALARTITLAMCEAFSGPHKNYHTDREMARMLGFPDVVVQGMMSVCFVADMLAAAFGEGWQAGGKLDVRLVNVVWPEDTVTARGRVRETVAEGSRRRALCDVWCEKGDGTVTVIGTASAIT